LRFRRLKSSIAVRKRGGESIATCKIRRRAEVGIPRRMHVQFNKEEFMALLDICTYPDPVLRRKAAEIKEVDRDVLKLIDDMAETMYDAPGIGLAANQVGELLRLLVVDIQKEDCEHGLIVLMNPVIVAAQGEITCEEGCLSVPDFFSSVKRYEEITVRGIGRDAKPLEINASGLLAVALQHEMDHLDGKLFIDRLGLIARDIFRRRWKKKQKEAQT